MQEFRKRHDKNINRTLECMPQNIHCSIDTEQSQELKPEKIRDITIVEQHSGRKITGKFVFVLFCIGIFTGDIITSIINRGSLYDKLFATITMLSAGVVVGLVVWLCNKYWGRK